MCEKFLAGPKGWAYKSLNIKKINLVWVASHCVEVICLAQKSYPKMTWVSSARLEYGIGALNTLRAKTRSRERGAHGLFLVCPA